VMAGTEGDLSHKLRLLEELVTGLRGLAARVEEAGRDVARAAHRAIDAARFLNCSRSLVYEMMDSLELPYVRVRGTRRVMRSALEAYVEKNGVGK
jgi:excisionase family DNA binding protein